MCFGVAPSAYRSVHAAPIFRSFLYGMYPHGNGCLRNIQLLGNLQAFFAIGYRLRPKEPAIDSSQPFWADFHASCYSRQNCRQN